MTLSTAKTKLFLIIATVLLVSVAFLSLFVGKYPLSLEKILEGDVMHTRIFINLRLSRVIVGVFGGVALGIAGFVFQTVFRNPLASPDIIGVSSGASTGAAVGILFFSGVFVTVFAFLGALLATAVAILLSMFDRSGKNSTIVLAGIAVHSITQTVLMCLKLCADPEKELARIEYWIMGSLNAVSLDKILGNVLLGAVCVLLLVLLHRRIILLSGDEGEVRLLGVNVRLSRFIVLSVATLTVSSVVSITGLVSFTGLLAPHIARIITRENRMSTMCLSGIIGGILLCIADILARSVSDVELPVSIFTGALGAPFLVYLILKRRSV